MFTWAVDSLLDIFRRSLVFVYCQNYTLSGIGETDILECHDDQTSPIQYGLILRTTGVSDGYVVCFDALPMTP